MDESRVLRRPRGNEAWPEVGIFAQRAKDRPNRIGVTTCRVVAVDGAVLHVVGLDAVDGTPVLDIKPHMVEFGPRGEVHQPSWATELMRGYW
ncbi:MAG: TrmO family methyltransferase [Acidimicrobiales bacterium]